MHTPLEHQTPHEHAPTREDGAENSLFAEPDKLSDTDVDAELEELRKRERSNQSATNMEYNANVQFSDTDDDRDVREFVDNVTRRRPRKTMHLPNAEINEDGSRGAIQYAKEHTDGTDEVIYKVNNADELLVAIQDKPRYWF